MNLFKQNKIATYIRQLLNDVATLKRDVLSLTSSYSILKRGTSLTNPGNPLYSIMQMFVIKTVMGDYCICRTWDGINEGSVDVLVAKPWKLRRTPFDGYTVNGISYDYDSNTTREATKNLGEEDETTENQLVIPRYLTDDDLLFACYVSYGTGVTYGGDKIVWLDINNDGRAWARSYA